MNLKTIELEKYYLLLDKILILARNDLFIQRKCINAY